VGIADQKRIGKVLAEIGERGERLGIVRRFQVGIAEVVGNVVSEFAGAGLGAVERVDGFAIVVIERAGIADHQPGQRSGIFLGVTARIGFDSGIGGGSPVLQQLLRHGAKAGRGDKGLPHPAHPRRNGLRFFLLLVFLVLVEAAAFFLGFCSVLAGALFAGSDGAAGAADWDWANAGARMPSESGKKIPARTTTAKRRTQTLPTAESWHP
jgi:hypothetical protein